MALLFPHLALILIELEFFYMCFIVDSTCIDAVLVIIRLHSTFALMKD